MQTDTLSVIESSKIVAFYSDMLDQQATQFTILISVIGVVVVLFAGFTLWWNYIGAKQKIVAESEKTRRLLKKEIDKWKEDQQQVVVQSIDDKVKLLVENVDADRKQTKEELLAQIKHYEAELSRLYASSCYKMEKYLLSAEWAFSAFDSYRTNPNDSEACQVVINFGIDALNHSLSDESLDEDIMDQLGKIEETVRHIPPILSSQKKEISKLIKKLKEKGAKKEEKTE